MERPRPAELVLGSVQLGIEYGATNETGKPSRVAALRLVQRAAESGIRTFDTARAYGDSEDRLGEASGSHKPVRTITKLSPLSHLREQASAEEVHEAVDESVMDSLDALRRDRLDCLLLHRASHMTSHGGHIWSRLIELVEEGSIAALGVSVQSPAELFQALESAHVRHIQLPFNLLDWRWRAAGTITAMERRRDVTVHARSVFLQGLLISSDAAIWPKIAGVDAEDLIAALDSLAKEFERESAADLCLGFARGQRWIDGVVVGMETEAQLNANLRLSVKPPLSPEDCAWIEAMLPRVPEQLLNPALWPRK